MFTSAHFPAAIWDGDTENPWRDGLSNSIAPDAKDWDRITAEVIAIESRIFPCVPTKLLFVDSNRLLDYEPDGTIIQPYRDIETAIEVANSTELNRMAIILFPGRYTLTKPLVLKPFLGLYGFIADGTYLEYAGDVLVAPTSMNLGSITLTNMLINCLSTDPADCAVRIEHRGSILFQNVAIFSSARGIVMEGDSFCAMQFSGVNSIYDGVSVLGSGYFSAEHGIIGCADPGSDDVITAAGTIFQLDDVTWFYNDRLVINGTYLRSSNDNRVNNTSGVAGTTVADALDTLGHVPDPAGLENGNYVLKVTDGVATWVLET